MYMYTPKKFQEDFKMVSMCKKFILLKKYR